MIDEAQFERLWESRPPIDRHLGWVAKKLGFSKKIKRVNLEDSIDLPLQKNQTRPLTIQDVEKTLRRKFTEEGYLVETSGQFFKISGYWKELNDLVENAKNAGGECFALVWITQHESGNLVLNYKLEFSIWGKQMEQAMVLLFMFFFFLIVFFPCIFCIPFMMGNIGETHKEVAKHIKTIFNDTVFDLK